MENSVSFGTLIGAPPTERPSGPEFRIAILGDFTGRANRGVFESGAALADRKPIKVDFDSIDEVLEELAPRLRIPMADSVLELELTELDAFDADELFGSSDLMEEVASIGRRIGRSVEKAVKWIQSWPEASDSSAALERSRAVVIPAADSLDEFTSLEGQPTASEDAEFDAPQVLQALCEPIFRELAGEDEPSKEELLAAASECTNAVARAVLHHPDFQALEGIWRELEWLLRRVDKGGRVKVLLFDISAEEFAADLGAVDDLTETGLYQLLVDTVAEGKKPQPLSLVVGRYEFDYTQTHASLLGRMGQIAARLNAPFLASVSSRLLAERFKPAADEELLGCWDEMRALPSSAFVGLALPGFLLRMPYGANGRSTEKFEFEEFDPANVAGSLLWGHPGSFCAALLAGGYLKAATWEFDPNSFRVLDKMPIYICEDDDGESMSIATEVQFGLSAGKTAASLGVMPLQATKDRDSIQVSQIRSLSSSNAGLLGGWQPAAAASTATTDADDEEVSSVDDDEEAVGASDEVDEGELDPELAALLGGGDDDEDDTANDEGELDPELAALLGDSGDSDDDDDDDDDLDPELRALLED